MGTMFSIIYIISVQTYMHKNLCSSTCKYELKKERNVTDSKVLSSHGWVQVNFIL